jgi:hypothetical protein
LSHSSILFHPSYFGDRIMIFTHTGLNHNLPNLCFLPITKKTGMHHHAQLSFCWDGVSEGVSGCPGTTILWSNLPCFHLKLLVEMGFHELFAWTAGLELAHMIHQYPLTPRNFWGSLNFC